MAKKYDIGIIGAGLAGSCLALLLSEKGYSTIIFEQDQFPKHKVCGEFVSLESYDILQELGLNISDLNIPIINKLGLYAQSGRSTQANLKQGGFGISRYELDHRLLNLMRNKGITVLDNTKVIRVNQGKIFTSDKQYDCTHIFGAYGKYSPAFINESDSIKSTAYLGVKYHIKGNFDPHSISLYGFEQGYCGMSKIESELYCLCYLVHNHQLKIHKSIPEMEKQILYKNATLQSVFEQATMAWDEPKVISNVKFSKRSTRHKDILTVGDAAGCISPLSGNGMSMAIRGATLLAKATHDNFGHLDEIHKSYNQQWDKANGSRVFKAGILNSIILNPRRFNQTLLAMNTVSVLKNKIVNDMQGEKINKPW